MKTMCRSHWTYRHKIKRTKYMYQNFKKFFVLDFEATCEKNVQLEPQEIIEFPCIAVNSETFTEEDRFHRYVKPTFNKILTPFCIGLTGIHQDVVANQPEFPTVLRDFEKWLSKNFDTVPSENAIFVICGNWDLQTILPQQCKLLNLTVPHQMTRWINLKTAFCKATGYYPRSLLDMLKYRELSTIGRLHSGIDDCRNIANVMCSLASSNYIFEETNRISR